MTPTVRRALITDDIFHACAVGKITVAEREKVIWLLKNNAWKLDHHCVMPTELRNRILEACRLLANADSEAASSTFNERTATVPTKSAIGIAESFGLTPSE